MTEGRALFISQSRNVIHSYNFVFCSAWRRVTPCLCKLSKMGLFNPTSRSDYQLIEGLAVGVGPAIGIFALAILLCIILCPCNCCVKRRKWNLYIASRHLLTTFWSQVVDDRVVENEKGKRRVLLFTGVVEPLGQLEQGQQMTNGSSSETNNGPPSENSRESISESQSLLLDSSGQEVAMELPDVSRDPGDGREYQTPYQSDDQSTDEQTQTHPESNGPRSIWRGICVHLYFHIMLLLIVTLSAIVLWDFFLFAKSNTCLDQDIADRSLVCFNLARKSEIVSDCLELASDDRDHRDRIVCYRWRGLNFMAVGAASGLFSGSILVTSVWFRLLVALARWGKTCQNGSCSIKCCCFGSLICLQIFVGIVVVFGICAFVLVYRFYEDAASRNTFNLLAGDFILRWAELVIALVMLFVGSLCAPWWSFTTLDRYDYETSAIKTSTATEYMVCIKNPA